MPRNPERIPEVLEAIEEEWHEHPDLRLGQLLWTIADGDPFGIEDSDLVRKLDGELSCEEFVGERSGWTDNLPDPGENADPKEDTAETLDRECVVCGTDLTIRVAADGTYEGGHYWSDLDVGNEREYWECDDCYATD
jgi:hypothetical protein